MRTRMDQMHRTGKIRPTHQKGRSFKLVEPQGSEQPEQSGTALKKQDIQRANRLRKQNRLELQAQCKDTFITTLLDNGGEQNYVTKEFAKKLKLKTFKLIQPYTLVSF